MSTMLIAAPTGAEKYEFNGNPDERAEIKARFDEAMRSNLYLAYVKTPGETPTQIRSFDEVPAQEETNVILTPRLIGG